MSINNANIWICIYFPQLSVEIFTRSSGAPAFNNEQKPEQAIVVLEKQRVFSLNPTAMALGIRVGNSMDTAYSLSNDVICIERSIDKEARHLQHLAGWAYQFTPNVAIFKPDALLLDVTGCLTLFDGLENLHQLMSDGLSIRGYRPLISISKTPKAALLIAHSKQSGCAPSPTQNVYLGRLINPIAIRHMQVDKKIISGLEQMGIEHMKALLALPRSGLSRRFGTNLTDYLLRLIGKLADPQSFISPAPRFHHDIIFLSDVTNLTSLTFPINRLLGELSHYLTGRQLQINQLTWHLSHRSHKTRSFSIQLANPENAVKVFLTLTQLKLDQITDVKELDCITLSVDKFYPAEAQLQDMFQQRHQGQQNINQLLNMFHTRLGPGHCFGLSEANDHRPEKAWKRIKPLTKNVQQNSELQDGQLQEQAEIVERPIFLVAKPQRLKAYDGQPYLSGKLILLKGPERIDFGWWDQPIGQPLTRDYYTAQNASGSIYWIFKYLKHWYLHGIFS